MRRFEVSIPSISMDLQSRTEMEVMEKSYLAVVHSIPPSLPFLISLSHLPSYLRDLITRQGLPAAKTSSGMSLVTTLPAPITVRLPIVTPGQITALPPTHTSSPILMGLAYSTPEALSTGAMG